MSSTLAKEPPLHFLVPLFPGFQLLDLTGPLDILNVLADRLQRTTNSSITLTFVASTLDPVPTKLVGPKSGRWTFEHDADAKAQNRGFSQTLTPDFTFNDYLAGLGLAHLKGVSEQFTDPPSTSTDSSDGGHRKPIHRPDVILLPGGIGTRVERSHLQSGGGGMVELTTLQPNVHDLQQFIVAVAPVLTTAIVTVCTGSDALAGTGLLDGRRATTNMTRFDFVSGRRPQVQWLRKRRWVRSRADEVAGSEKVFKGEMWTSAGVSAGMDVTLALIAEFYGGIEVAREISRVIEYEWREVGEGEVDEYYNGEGWE